MLEREFEIAEVREAVALALKPEAGYGLGAHRTLLDLSRIRGGTPRLVTTNFDLLFEECEPGIASSNPPQLPDPSRYDDFQGIIHLHGRVGAEYCRACDNEFVLSSADFGLAYLSDGWATRYIQALLQRFRIVFVGYSADDPPVQYLLEAFSRFAKPENALYAFQSGDATEAKAQWEHKGVEPIPYDIANGHAALWQTLSAWAERARDVDGWHDRLIVKAANGPETMVPFERGMIAHLASTPVGSRLLATSENVLPAEWLFVIDRNARYGQVGKVDIYDEIGLHFDPFDAFGLDSDVPPLPTDPDAFYAKRAVPESAWDGMVSTPTDRTNLPIEATSPLRGGANQVPTLPPRLWDLGLWFVKVAHQPAALWWAAQQEPLHRNIQQRIDWSLRHEVSRYLPAVRDGWRLLLACWQQNHGNPDNDRYTIQANAEIDGWSFTLVREAMSLYRPLLTVKRASRTVKAPRLHPELTLQDIVDVNVEYPRPHESFDIPTDMLGYAVASFRQQLEYAVQLEHETGSGTLYFDTTRPDDGDTLDVDGYGLTGHLVVFTNMVKKLAATSREAAHQEVQRWSGDDALFTRLRICAGGFADLTTPEEASRIFQNLDDESFWGSQHERDLLFALRDRWPEIPPPAITVLELRLREGHFPWDEPQENRENLIAHYRLNRLHWLWTRGVTFSFDYEIEKANLRSSAPDWTEDASKHTAQPHISKMRRIGTDTSSICLQHLPIGELLETAQVLGQRQFDSSVLRQPFRGLADDRPARALAAVTDAARKDKFVPWAWDAVLSSEGKAATSLRMLSAVGHRLGRLSSGQLADIAHPVSEWLSKHSVLLLTESPQVFDLVWDAMICALAAVPEHRQFPGPDRRWVDESLNRPVGRMLDALFKDPGGKTFDHCSGLPDAWIRRLDQALALPGDHRQWTIVMIAAQLNWLFHVDPKWVSRSVLPIIDLSGDDSSAFWAGYLWISQPPQPRLYERLKPAFIRLACQPERPHGYSGKVAAMLLVGWISGEGATECTQSISDVELREILIHADDDLRSELLRYFQRWVLDPKANLDDRLIPFFARVWPRQRTLRTARVTGRLVDLAVSMPDRFPEIVAAILPRLVRIVGMPWGVSFVAIEATIVERHPRTLLDLLWVVLAEEPTKWPYKTTEILAQLAEQAETRHDPRLAELRRREQRR